MADSKLNYTGFRPENSEAFTCQLDGLSGRR
jgi:hypothetical protein